MSIPRALIAASVAQTPTVETPASGVLVPLVILTIGVAIVLGMILKLRLNAFFALIAAALVVSLLAPGALPEKVVRVAEAFKATAGKIGVAIAMAAVIGAAMTVSGAADRIVASLLRRLGERRAASALAASGFVLSIPVFFDTVFYLLCPLAKSTYRRTGRHYLLYLLALGAGGTATHTLVPPTPGPLFAADELDVDIGLMMLVGLAVGVPAAVAGMLLAAWRDRKMNLSSLPSTAEGASTADVAQLPGLAASLLPIALPVLLIAGHAVVAQIADRARQSSQKAAALPDASETPADSRQGSLQRWALTAEPVLAVVGNPNRALLASAALALLTYVRVRQPTQAEALRLVVTALWGAVPIVLITSAGGAFGGMLAKAGVGDAIKEFASIDASAASYSVLLLAFGVASLLKLSQGSTTVAMVTTSGMVHAMVGEAELDFHRVYLAVAIGCGAMVASWMNDSGFWVFCKMGGLNESEGLRTWTPLTAVMGFAGMAATMAMAAIWPLV